MKRALRILLTLTEKDIRIELRSRESLFSTMLLVMLLLLIFNVSVGSNPLIVEKVAAGILWSVITFAGTIAVSHLSDRDFLEDVHEGIRLTGVSGTLVYFSKFLTALLFLVGVEILMVPLFVILFNFQFGFWLVPFSSVLVLGTIGYAALGTLFSGLLGRERLKNLLLPVALFPALIPLLIVAIRATQSAMMGEQPPELPFLVGFDLIFLTASALLYDFVLEESA